jgi:hypothetical protein
MMNTLEFTNIETMLHNTSDVNLYSDHFDTNHESFNNPLIVELEDLYNNIISSFSNITTDQVNVITSLFDIFKYVQEIIDPDRLKNFSVVMSADDDIIFSRNNQNEYINLIIHPEEDFSLSIINKNNGSNLEYFDNHSVDYEKVALDFLR